MRCPACKSYIPEGLPEPISCPQCGSRVLVAPSTAPQAPQAPSDTPRNEPMDAEPSVDLRSIATNPVLPQALPFAPYLTIKTRVFLGQQNEPPNPSDGSLSFGAEGFSVVWNGGQSWEKFRYRELESTTVEEASVILKTKTSERILVLFQGKEGQGRKSRADAFVELLAAVRRGLSPGEIMTYRNRLG